MLEFFCISHIFLDLFKINFEKKYFFKCSNTPRQLLHLLWFFWGIFWSRTVFVFLIALTKKSARRWKFSATKSGLMGLMDLWTYGNFPIVYQIRASMEYRCDSFIKIGLAGKSGSSWSLTQSVSNIHPGGISTPTPHSYSSIHVEFAPHSNTLWINC